MNIIKLKREYKYQMELKETPNNMLCVESIKNNIENATIIFFNEMPFSYLVEFYSNVEPETLDIFLTSEKKLFDYEMATKIACDLEKQIGFLEENKKTILDLNLKDILVVNGCNFVVIYFDNLLDINNKQIELLHPINKSIFSSPELLEINILPTKISYKNVYYSVGSLIIFCYLRKNIRYLLKKEIDNILLKELNNTPLYWYIKRCIKENIQERKIKMFV
jgi:hypothetical protein